jgi:hypothetical protein
MRLGGWEVGIWIVKDGKRSCWKRRKRVNEASNRTMHDYIALTYLRRGRSGVAIDTLVHVMLGPSALLLILLHSFSVTMNIDASHSTRSSHAIKTSKQEWDGFATLVLEIHCRLQSTSPCLSECLDGDVAFASQSLPCSAHNDTVLRCILSVDDSMSLPLSSTRVQT